MKKPFTMIGMLVAIIFVLTSCYPGGAEYTSDTDLIVTNYDENFDFKSVNTYFLSDSIQHIVEEGKEPGSSFDNYILSEMQRNFDALGWQRLVDTTNSGGTPPDVNIVITIAEVTNYNVYSYPWYGGWGYGYYWKSTNYWGYPGYGWGYPWYGGGSYVTSYTTGTIHWRLFDPEKSDIDKEIVYVEWEGALNGLLGTTSSTTKDRITKGINQAFTQSPYLK